ALDVWKQEPPASDHPLLGLPDVVATPHIAGNTHEVAAHQGESVADALERLVREERPENILNPPTLAEFRWTGERKKPSAAEIEALGKGTGPAISDLDAEVESSEKAEAKPAVAPPAQGPTTHDSRPATSDSGLQPPASSLQPVEKKGFFGKIGSLFGGGKPAADAPSPAPAVAAAPSSAAAEPPPTAGRLPPATGADAGRIADARRKMEAILRDFVARVDRDPSICEFAKGKNVTVRYVIPDVDLSFSMAFAENVPRSSLGDPAGKPQVTLKMNAEVLDGVFMERIGGMKAAMSGQLAFSGNTMKAMSLQRIQKDLCRLYAEARVAVGDPGDLTGLTTHDATLRSTSPRPTTHDSGLKTQDSGPSGGIAAAPAIIHRIGDGEGTPSQRSHRITVGDERDDLIMAVEELYNAGLLTSTGGNVSVRRAGKPDEAWITPSALPKGALDPRLMVRVNLDGEGLDEDAKAPSSERLMHTRIMKLRPDINAVIHSHGIQAFLLGLAGLPFTPVCTESAFVGEMPRVPFHMPGSDELADAAVKALGKGRAVLLLNHGLLVAATSLRRGVDMTKIIERTAEVLLTCAKLGKQPPVIPADAREMLAGMGDLVG
ncbi:MAG: class II aldolase/adducin family protein, partial [Deltaproteobacteria bacterium]|nr:class II aldolase/adducin family protein [Deltaproteobacteria bacterium]